MRIIGIDCRFAAVSAGLGTYTRGIVSELLKLEHPGISYVLFVSKECEDWVSTLSTENFRVITVSAAHYTLREQWELRRVLRFSKIDLLYVPHFNAPLFCPVPFVVTIHDLILHHYPSTQSLVKKIAYRLLMRNAVKASQAIIAVSAFTAKDIVEMYGASVAPKISVGTEGVSENFARPDAATIDATLARYDLQRGYLLYVGNAKPHKNVSMLLKAYREAKNAPPLVLVTDARVSSRLESEDRVRVLSDLDHSDLPALYAGASCFITASLYEGFCLPILEARACGCPVIATNVTAIPEVAGPHALLVEPRVESLRAAMEQLPRESDPPPSSYSWKKAAEHLHGILTASYGPRR